MPPNNTVKTENCYYILFYYILGFFSQVCSISHFHSNAFDMSESRSEDLHRERKKLHWTGMEFIYDYLAEPHFLCVPNVFVVFRRDRDKIGSSMLSTIT